MRKNKLMRAAAGLMVATLLTTSIISGTLAKYTVTESGTDTARVAKFGVAITANGNTFAEKYKTDDQTASVGAESVVSTSKVVAPGTSGSMTSMELSGKPEVAVKVSYVGEFSLNDKWTVGSNGEYYCPLEIKINDGQAIKGTDYNSAIEFATAVNNAIAAYSKEYAAGTDLSIIKNDSLKVTWAWNFNGNDDAKDTALGKAVADNESNAGTVTLKVTTTVTQID